MDAQRLSTLLDAHSAALSLYIRQWLDRAAAEDVVQETFVRLMLRPVEPDSPRAWLYTTARNEAISQARSQSRRRRRESATQRDGWFEPTPEESLDAQTARAYLEELPHAQREIIVLRIWGGMTLKEIAGIVGSSPSRVFDQYRHGINAIRKRMGAVCQSRKD